MLLPAGLNPAHCQKFLMDRGKPEKPTFSTVDGWVWRMGKDMMFEQCPHAGSNPATSTNKGV